MIESKDYPPLKWQEKCPDCGFKYMNIWEHGRIHCGNCLMGGNFRADKYKFIEDKYFSNLKKDRIMK